jgi:c(7)-type cytochrome triheme protein
MVRNRVLAGAGLLALGTICQPSLADEGAKVVETACAACHMAGVLNAPKLGVAADWAERIKQGEDVLIKHAIEGFKAMPARGGNPGLTDDQIKAAVLHMVAGAKGGGAAAPAPAAAKSEPAPAASEKAAAEPVKVAAVEPAPEPQKPAAAPKKRKPINTFNRLLKPASERNPPPPEDGIHDPENEGTYVLQAPRDAFSTMAKANSGNRVDWVKSLNEETINPRYDRLDANRKPVVLDLNIVREVKGSMPDVVYPHKQHTEWLDCSNCHPQIFVPKKGANSISMAAILLGEKCGVCHGKVAFPVSECRKCHSKNKPRK